jgi:predicted dehydrogenase
MNLPHLRVAVIGAGNMGRWHARLCTMLEGAQLAAVVDPQPEAGQSLATSLGAPWFATPADLDPATYDAVIICTPTDSHLAQSLWFAQAGKHLLVEKPHRLPWEDAAPLADLLARQPHLVYMVGMTHRYYPEVGAARAALVRYPIGDLLAVRSHIHMQGEAGGIKDWYFHRAMAGGGVMATNGVHCLDRILWLTGRPFKRMVASYGQPLRPSHDVEDLAVVLFELEPAIPVHCSFLWSEARIRSYQLELAGTDGVLRINSWQGFELYRHDEQIIEQAYPPDATDEDRTIAGLGAEVAAFIHACRSGAPSPVPLVDLEAATQILAAAYAQMAATTVPRL